MLCVLRTVVDEAGDRRHGHSAAEDAAQVLGHGVRRGEASVAPAPDGSALRIDVRQALQLPGNKTAYQNRNKC